MNKSQITKKIFGLLAAQLGIEEEDIKLQDDFAQDLHMSPSDKSDFVHLLEQEGLPITPDDTKDVTSVEELVEFLSQEVA